jgi:hypothetical protein
MFQKNYIGQKIINTFQKIYGQKSCMGQKSYREVLWERK